MRGTPWKIGQILESKALECSREHDLLAINQSINIKKERSVTGPLGGIRTATLCIATSTFHTLTLADSIHMKAIRGFRVRASYDHVWLEHLELASITEETG